MALALMNCVIILAAIAAVEQEATRLAIGSQSFQGTVVDRAEFNKRLAAWRDSVNHGMGALPLSERLSSRLGKTHEIMYKSDSYRNLIALGAGAVPFMVEEVQKDSALAWALCEITQWRARLMKEGNTNVKPIVYLEEFPDLRGQTYIPTGRFWSYWWETGRKKVPDVFERFYGLWQEKKAAGDDAGAKDRYQRMIDLGIVALPCMVGKVQAGDKEMIPAIAALSNKAVTKDATPEAVQAWWAGKKGELRVLLEPETTEQGRSMKADNVATVAISEMYFRPGKADEAKWVELHNYGDRAVSIAGWSIADGQGHVFVVPSGLEKVPPKGYVLVTFGGAAGEADRLNFDEGKAAKASCREKWVGDVFSGDGNECALYASEKPDAATMVDYVCWGRRPASPGERQKDAIERRLWPDGRGVFVGHDARPGDRPGLPMGGSLFRMFSDGLPAPGGWLISGAEDVTPGQPNRWPAPMPLLPADGCVYAPGVRSCRWTLLADPPGDLTYQVVVAKDREFTAMVFDKVVGGSPPVTFELTLGTYFWRIRCLYKEKGKSEAQATGWSKVVQFTVEKP